MCSMWLAVARPVQGRTHRCAKKPIAKYTSLRQRDSAGLVIAAQHTTKSPPETALSTVGGSQNPSWGSKPGQPVKDVMTL